MAYRRTYVLAPLTAAEIQWLAAALLKRFKSHPPTGKDKFKALDEVLESVESNDNVKIPKLGPRTTALQLEQIMTDYSGYILAIVFGFADAYLEGVHEIVPSAGQVMVRYYGEVQDVEWRVELMLNGTWEGEGMGPDNMRLTKKFTIHIGG